MPEQFPQQLDTSDESQNKLPSASRKARFFLGGFGLLFLTVGLYMIVSQFIFIHSAVETTGVIIGNKETTSYHNHRTEYQYCPQAEFTVNGQRYEFTNRWCTNSSYPVGESVKILYNPQNPSDAEIKMQYSWIVPIIFIILGGLTFFAAVFNKIKASY